MLVPGCRRWWGHGCWGRTLVDKAGKFRQKVGRKVIRRRSVEYGAASPCLFAVCLLLFGVGCVCQVAARVRAGAAGPETSSIELESLTEKSATVYFAVSRLCLVLLNPGFCCVLFLVDEAETPHRKIGRSLFRRRRAGVVACLPRVVVGRSSS